MRQLLEKYKREQKIDFIQLDRQEFLLFDFANGNKFKIIFFDNKYREDTIDIKKKKEWLEKTVEKYKKGLDDYGIFNTLGEYKKFKNQLDFVNKYCSR